MFKKFGFKINNDDYHNLNNDYYFNKVHFVMNDKSERFSNVYRKPRKTREVKYMLEQALDERPE